MAREYRKVAGRTSGPQVTDAFRFWFDNPQLDYGYALRLAPPESFTTFRRWESELGEHGPVLELSYALGAADPIPTVSQWGLLALVLLILCAASAILRTPRAMRRGGGKRAGTRSRRGRRGGSRLRAC
jgi:hypothetical protein